MGVPHLAGERIDSDPKFHQCLNIVASSASRSLVPALPVSFLPRLISLDYTYMRVHVINGGKRKSLERPNKFPGRRGRQAGRHVGDVTPRRRIRAALTPQHSDCQQSTAAIGTTGIISFKPPCLSLPGLAPDARYLGWPGLVLFLRHSRS